MTARASNNRRAVRNGSGLTRRQQQHLTRLSERGARDSIQLSQALGAPLGQTHRALHGPSQPLTLIPNRARRHE